MRTLLLLTAALAGATVEPFDVSGHRVASEGTLDAGTRTFAFGAGLAAGVYVVRASGAGASASATVVVR